MEITWAVLYVTVKEFVLPIIIPAVGALCWWVWTIWNKINTVEHDAEDATNKLEDRMRIDADVMKTRYDLEIAGLKASIAAERTHNAMTFAGKADMQRLEDKVMAAFLRLDTKLDNLIMMKE